eukprot:7627091-Pyramimonas_sp.AAC.1
MAVHRRAHRGVRHQIRSAGAPRVQIAAGAFPGLDAVPARSHLVRGHGGALQQRNLGVAQHVRL